VDDVLILHRRAPLTVEEIRTRIAPALQRRGATAGYLFGSYARGDADAWSDVDLVVVMPTDRHFVERPLDLDEVLDALPVATDILVYTPEEFERGMERDVGIFAMLRDEGVRIL
jgi:predicted nucleotidyltransferase